MRLNRLDLTRYGKFTDEQVDFGEPLHGQPDLHIVYGPNEAGKSTAFSAFLDLLFGIERLSRYAFLHEKTMLVGADLSLTGGRITLKRTKAAQDNLRDESDKPIFGGPLAAEIGNLTRTTYATIFSLDDKVLEHGGEEIIKSKGDLGQLLYAASAGLSDLSKKLDAVRRRTEEIYKKGGSKNEIAELKTKLQVLKAKKDGIDTQAAQYKQLLTDRDRMHGRREAARIDVAQNKTRIKEIGRLLSAYPHLAALRRARDFLAAEPDYPDPPPEWHDQIVRLRSEETEKCALQQAAEARIRKGREALSGVAVDHNVLRVEGRLAQLEQSKARGIAAEKDLPVVTDERKHAEAGTAAILAKLGQPNHPDAKSLLLPISAESALSALIDSRPKLEESKSAAEAEKTRADTNVAKAQSALASIENAGSGETPATAYAYISSLLADARKASFHAEITLQTKNLAASQTRLRSQLSALQPWSGETKDLAIMAPPSAAELQRLRTQFGNAQKEFDNAENNLVRLTAEHESLASARANLSEQPGVTADRLAQEIRAARNHAWTAHRRTLDQATADVFAAALHRDDEVTINRLAYAASIAQANQAMQAAASAESAAVHGKSTRDSAQQKLEAVSATIRQIIEARTPGGLSALSLAEWEDWLSSREKAVQTWESMETAQRELDAAKSEKAAFGGKLASALEGIGLKQPDPDDFDLLAAAAQSLVDQSGETKSRRTALAEREWEVKERAADITKADAALHDWQAAWSAKCQACWIGEAGPAPDLGFVKAILKELPGLEASLEKTDSLQGRIEGMTLDQQTFAKKIGQLADDLGVAHQPDQALQTIALIQARLVQAKTRLGLYDAKEKEIARDERELADLNSALSKLQATKTAMTSHFSVASLNEVADLLNRSKERKTRKEQVSSAADEILKILQHTTLAEAEALLDANDTAARRQQLMEAESDATGLDQTLGESIAALTRAQDALDKIGGDDEVARIEAERRVLHLDIEERAKHYLKLRIGTLAAEQGLLLYREAHRSSMLTNASEAFHTISRGHYHGLSTQPDKDGEILIAKCKDGSTKYAEDLSVGTRLQLYLALRVAGYKELASHRPSLPFIADDIMESFDDFRAEEAFRLFAEMAQLGQVIYLTHHRHLLPIAAAVCPSVKVHELPSP